jgi:hypothetical protein
MHAHVIQKQQLYELKPNMQYEALKVLQGLPTKYFKRFCDHLLTLMLIHDFLLWNTTGEMYIF